MFRVGEVVGFYSDTAGKRKYHLCVSIDDHFIFLNSPKPASFVGDFEIDCCDITGLTPTPSGKSIASCNTVIKMTTAELLSYNATVVGVVANCILKDLLIFVESLTTIEEETKNAIIDGLGDHVGT